MMTGYNQGNEGLVWPLKKLHIWKIIFYLKKDNSFHKKWKKVNFAMYTKASRNKRFSLYSLEGSKTQDALGRKQSFSIEFYD